MELFVQARGGKELHFPLLSIVDQHIEGSVITRTGSKAKPPQNILPLDLHMTQTPANLYLSAQEANEQHVCYAEQKLPNPDHASRFLRQPRLFLRERKYSPTEPAAPPYADISVVQLVATCVYCGSNHSILLVGKAVGT